MLNGSESAADTVDVAHRKASGGMIVCFKHRTARDEVYAKRFGLQGKSSRDLGFLQPTRGNFIYINESLTFDRSVLMKKVRDCLADENEGKMKDENIKIRTRSGKIKVQDTNKNYKFVNNMDDLENLL